MNMENISRTQIEFAIDERIIGKNAERNRAILKRRLIDGITYEQIAEEFDLSVKQVRNIVYKAEAVLFKHIK